MKSIKFLSYSLFSISLFFSNFVSAANYTIDTKGSHASINFKVIHLGYSWLQGRFNTFDGEFTYDAKKTKDLSIKVNIDTASIDSNHARRDKHLRGKQFLAVNKYPKAEFQSTSFNNKTGVLTGDFTLHGVTKPIKIKVRKTGEGKDPWGGYRVGFSGTTSFKMKDFGITKDLGPASETVYFDLYIEGIRQ